MPHYTAGGIMSLLVHGWVGMRALCLKGCSESESESQREPQSQSRRAEPEPESQMMSRVCPRVLEGRGACVADQFAPCVPRAVPWRGRRSCYRR